MFIETNSVLYTSGNEIQKQYGITTIIKVGPNLIEVTRPSLELTMPQRTITLGNLLWVVYNQAPQFNKRLICIANDEFVSKVMCSGK
jgi:hypothetical protein